MADSLAVDRTPRDIGSDVLRGAYRLRAALESVWARDTAHPSCAEVDQPQSSGQCYVSAMALAERISTIRGVKRADLCRGSVSDQRGDILIADHAWVVVAFKSAHADLLIDLTLDQAGPFPSVMTSMSANFERVVYCKADSRVLRDVTNDAVWLRYMVLDMRLGQMESAHA
jgi:hypothetical protein